MATMQGGLKFTVSPFLFSRIPLSILTSRELGRPFHPRQGNEETSKTPLISFREEFNRKKAFERDATTWRHWELKGGSGAPKSSRRRCSQKKLRPSPSLLQAAPNNNLAHRAPQGQAATSSDPEAAPYNSSSGYGDHETKGKLHPHHSHHYPHHHHSSSSAFAGLPPALDAHSLDKLKSQALAKARAVQSSLIAAVKSGGAGGGGFGGVGAGVSASAAGSSSSHGGFGVVVPPATGSATGGAAAPATALSAFSDKLGRLCDRVESSRATALACR